MPFLADFASIQPDLRRMYPTGNLEEVDFDALDAHLPHPRLMALLGEVGGVQGANAVLVPEIARSHFLHVGWGAAPDWERFNREMTPRERVSAVEKSEGEIVYWNLRLSRVGPFWTGNWNRFGLRRGLVVAEVVDRPESDIWDTISKPVLRILGKYELKEVLPPLLSARIPWLRQSSDDAAGDATSDTHCTIYDALFSDV